MGKWSSIGALMNKIENNQMLSEAKRLLDQDRWDRLRQSYRQLFWFQITPVFVFVIAIILVFFFCPTTAADLTQIKAAIILFGTAFFVLFFFSGLVDFISVCRRKALASLCQMVSSRRQSGGTGSDHG